MFKHQRRINRLMKVLADSYGVTISALIILWLLTSETIFLVNIFVSIMPGIFFLIPFSLFIALQQKSIRTGLLTLIPIITFTMVYSPAFQPRENSPAQSDTLSLLTYNLRASNANAHALGDILTHANADIVALQEVNIAIADWATTQWQAEYPYQLRFILEEFEDNPPAYVDQIPMMQNDVRQYTGRLILSRYPILAQEVVPSSIGTTLYIRTEIDIKDNLLTVYNVHLPPPLPQDIFSTEIRHTDLQSLLQVAASSDNIILMGDYNMTDQSNDYALISAQYTDVFYATQSGLGTTWPNGNNLSPLLSFFPSLIRIDYIFVSDSIMPHNAHVIREGVSDHYPLYAEVSLK